MELDDYLYADTCTGNIFDFLGTELVVRKADSRTAWELTYKSGPLQ